MEDKERQAISQELEHFQNQRHEDRRELEKQSKQIIAQAIRIRELEGVIMDAVADLKAGIGE